MTNFVNNGDIWSAFLANQSLGNTPDGETQIPGHSSKIVDAFLDDSPNQIKSRFYFWFENLRVSVLNALQVSLNAGFVVLGNGSQAVIAAQTLSIPDNTTQFILIDSGGLLTITGVIPASCVLLAKVTTLAGIITDIQDLRPPFGFSINTYSVPLVSIFRPGDIKHTLRSTVDPGWLLCPPVDTFVSPTIYPELFNVIQYTFGQNGSLFKLPLGDVYLVGGNSPGSIVGSNEKTLQTENLPSHSHIALQSPHTHNVNDTGHVHPPVNATHNHSLTQSPHSHGINDPGHEHTIAAGPSSTPGVNVKNSISGDAASQQQAIGAALRNFTLVSIQGNNASVQIQPAVINVQTPIGNTNIQLEPTSINLNVSPTGNNLPFDNRPKTMISNMWIKT